MTLLNKTLEKNILEHAEKEYPNESCGLIVKVGKSKKYIPCINMADKEYQENEFVISGEEYADAEDLGEILAVVHSHCNHTTQPSVRDRAMCSAMEIPWVICSWPDADIRVIVPEQAPLIGRPFAHGTAWDCIGLIRDYYKQVLGIEISHYEHDSYWWQEGKSLYEEHYAKEGFFKVTDGSLREHDLIIMQIRAKVPNHGAIYLGNNRILHHLFGKLSKEDVYGGYWQEHTSFVLRHKSLAGDV